MLNVFQLSANDQSIFYLGQIFGNMGIALSGTGPALLASMFKILNSALLIIGTLVVAYVTVMGAIFTASEGDFMGKKWGNIWTPLRTLAGIAALFPTASGYCASQIIIMWIVVQGIGAADTVWTSAVEYLNSSKGLSTSTPSSAFTDVAGTLPSILKTVFQNTVCQAAIVKAVNNKPDMMVQTTNPGEGNYIFNFGNRDSEATKSECGSVEVKGAAGIDPANTDLLKASKDAQKNAMQTIIPVFDVLANYYVKQVIREPLCWGSGIGDDAAPIQGKECNPKQTDKAANDYCLYFGKYNAFFRLSCPYTSKENVEANVNMIMSQSGSNFFTDAARLFYGYAENYAIQNTMKKIQDQKSATAVKGKQEAVPTLETAFATAKANGWIFAGAYYYYIANQNNPRTEDFANFIMTGQIEAKSPVFGKGNPPVDNVYGYFAMDTAGTSHDGTGGYGIADNMAKKAHDALAGTSGGLVIGGGKLPNEFDVGIGPIANIAIGVANAFMGAITPGINGKDPIVTLHELGHSYLIDADIVFITFLVIGLFIGMMSTLYVVWGTTVSPWVGLFQFMQGFVIPLVYFFIGYLITIGGLLGVYLPLVPFTLFTFGAIGWFIAVIEAMCAAPLVALGMLSPSGHEILGKAEPAVMIVMNIFMRPTLMVFGMMAAMLLGVVVLNFINASFYTVMSTMGKIGIVESFLYITVYTTLVISALNKCYSLIHVLPEKVLTWIGGTAIGYNEGEAATQMKEATSGAGKATGGAGRAMSEVGPGKGAQSYGKARKEAAKEKGGGAEAAKAENKDAAG